MASNFLVLISRQKKRLISNIEWCKKCPSGERYEMEFPKGADMKPPREFFYPFGGLLILCTINHQKGGKDYG
jgi:hypothetical protein